MSSRDVIENILGQCDQKVRLVNKSFKTLFDASCKHVIWDSCKHTSEPDDSEAAGLAKFLEIFEQKIKSSPNQESDTIVWGKFLQENKGVLIPSAQTIETQDKPLNGFDLLKRYFTITRYIDSKTKIKFSQIKDEILQAFRGAEKLNLARHIWYRAGYIKLPSTSRQVPEWFKKHQVSFRDLSHLHLSLPPGYGIPEEITYLTQVKDLHVSSNYVCFGSFTRLR